MEKNVKNLIIAKVWNQILSDDILPDRCENLTDLSNYAFRLNFIIRSNEKNKCQGFDQIVAKCNNFLAKNSNLDNYLNIQETKTQKMEIVIMDNSLSEIKRPESEPDKQSVENNSENALSSSSLDNKNENLVKASISPSQINLHLCAIKQALDEENSNQIQKIINEIVSNFDSTSIQIFCINFLNIENFKPEILNTSNLESINLSLHENKICFFFENLIKINSSISLLSYSISSIFLKSIFSNFIIASIDADSSHENIGRVLSRKILNLSANLCNEFQHQFVVSCLVPFIVEANKKNSNKIFIEFFLKLIKDNLNESGCDELLKIILNELNSIKWSEIIYNVLSILIEKITNISSESIEIILDKMKNDSIDLCKSTIFSKFLLNLLNKFKIKSTVTISNNQNRSFSSLSQLSQSKDNKTAKQNDENGLNKNLIDQIEIIINNNKTLIKKTLQNLIKNFRN